jgi:hypothetical protein
MLRLRDIEVRYVRDEAEPIVTTVGEVDAQRVVWGRPVRRARSHAANGTIRACSGTRRPVAMLSMSAFWNSTACC